MTNGELQGSVLFKIGGETGTEIDPVQPLPQISSSDTTVLPNPNSQQLYF